MSGLVDSAGRPMGKPVPRYVDDVGIPMIGDAMMYMAMVPKGAKLEVKPGIPIHPMLIALWISTSIALGKRDVIIEALEDEVERLRSLIEPKAEA